MPSLNSGLGRPATFVMAAAVAAAAASAQGTPAVAKDWVVRPEWVKAHENFLAGPALQGRGSATQSEAVAAAYVAAQFESYGLSVPPGMSGYTQVAKIVRPRLTSQPKLTLNDTPLRSLTLIIGFGDVRGKVAVFASSDAAQMPAGPVVVATNPDAPLQDLLNAAVSKGVELLIVPESPASRTLFAAVGNATSLRSYLQGSRPSRKRAVASLSSKEIALLAGKNGGDAALTVPIVEDVAETSNAIGYLPGTDPQAGALLISAHLDHLGVVQGTIMPGANDDASGTTAVLELAHAFASGERMRRSILFVCYGSEELGGYGSRYFGDHPPVPLSGIVANLELEMIGAQDPKLPAGTMMMTGFDRSDFGEILKRNGALVAADPYPEQHFFERSDNYSLALKGIVAHTVSGWAVPPTYHQPTDTAANLDIAYMTRAIQSLIGPLRLVANGGETPKWRSGGQPVEAK
jgi:hypothetical protein